MHAVSSIPSVLSSDIEYLQIQLEHCFWLAEELDVTLSKQDAVQRPGSYTGGADAANERSVCNNGALEASRELLKVMRQWKAKAIGLPGVEVHDLFDGIAPIAAWMVEQEVPKRLARTPHFADAYREITRAIETGKDVVDLPSADVMTPMPWLLFPVERLNDVLTPKEITSTLAPFSVVLTEMKIANWGKAGYLEVHEREHLNGVTKRCYCIGDVIDVWLGIEERKALREARRAAEEQKKIERLERKAARLGTKLIVESDMGLAA